MSNLFSSLRATATALDALQRSAAASENNVTNASTPGYARQRIQLKSLEFNSAGGLTGGVSAGGLISSRDQYVEESVRQQSSKLGQAQETSIQLTGVDSAFNLNDSTGIAPNLDKLFTSFSAWTIAPSSTAAKENVLAAAADVAVSFNKTADDLQRAGQNAEGRIQTTLDNVSAIAERIRQHNVAIRAGGQFDAGLDANVHADLEELASLVNAKTMFQPDGTATVLIGREIPLVIGDNRYDLTLATDATVPPPGREGAVPKVLILDASGNNVTAKIDEGKIGALLTFRNNTIPSFLGSATSDGELNRLARTVANRVNTILTEGEPGGPPAPTKLFEFVNDVSAAQSLKVNTLFTVSSLKASNPPPAIDVSNGRALRLAALAHPTDAADKLDNMSFVSFTGKIASTAGRIAGEATRAVDSHRQLLAQARTVRETVSGVSLDEEAISLVMFQRAYEATARMVTILDEISRMAVNIGRN